MKVVGIAHSLQEAKKRAINGEKIVETITVDELKRVGKVYLIVEGGNSCDMV